MAASKYGCTVSYPEYSTVANEEQPLLYQRRSRLTEFNKTVLVVSFITFISSLEG